MQPTAQAVGTKQETGASPEGAKETLRHRLKEISCLTWHCSEAKRQSRNRSRYGHSTTTTNAARCRTFWRAASGGALLAQRHSNSNRPSRNIMALVTESLSRTAPPRSKSRWLL